MNRWTKWDWLIVLCLLVISFGAIFLELTEFLIVRFLPIVAASISVIISWLFNKKGEYHEKMLLHSEKMVNKFFIPLLGRPYLQEEFPSYRYLSPLPAILPEHEEYYLVRNVPVYFQYAKQHLKTGYPKLYTRFIKLKDDLEKFNENFYDFIEKIAQNTKQRLAIEKERESCFHSKQFALSVYHEICWRDNQKHDWQIRIDDNTLQYGTEYNPKRLLYTSDNSKLQESKRLFNEIVSNQNIRNKAKNFHETRESLVERRGEIFEIIEGEIVDPIQLFDRVLRGKCDMCT